MEDIDLYGDLDNFDLSKTINELETKNSTLTNLIDELKSTLDKMCVEVQESRKVNETLKENISSLFKTAQLEINRKNQIITELREELDNIKFRREPRNFTGQKRALNTVPENENVKRFKLIEIDVSKNTNEENTDTLRNQRNLEEGEIDFDDSSNKSEHSDSSRRDTGRDNDRHRPNDSRKPNFRHDKYWNNRPFQNRSRGREHNRDDRYHVQRADYFRKQDSRKFERDRRDPRHSPDRAEKEVRSRSKEREFKRSRSSERDRRERPENHPRHHTDDRDKRDRTDRKPEKIEVRQTVNKNLVTSEKRVSDVKSGKSQEYNHDCSNLRIVDDNIIEEINQIQRSSEPDRSVCNLLNLTEDNLIKQTSRLPQFSPIEISEDESNVPVLRILDKTVKKTEENTTIVTDAAKKPGKSDNKRLISMEVYEERNKTKLGNKNTQKTEHKSVKEVDITKEPTVPTNKQLLIPKITEEGNKIKKGTPECEKQIAPKTADNPPKKNTKTSKKQLVSVKMSQKGIKIEKFEPKCETQNKTETKSHEKSVKVTDTVINPPKSANKQPVPEEKIKTDKVLPESTEQHENAKKTEGKPTKQMNVTKKLTKPIKQQISDTRNETNKNQPEQNDANKTYECTMDNNKIKLKIKKTAVKEREDTVDAKENVVGRVEQMIEETIKQKPLDKNPENKTKLQQKPDETKAKKVLKDCNQEENKADHELFDNIILKLSEALDTNTKADTTPAKEQPANQNATKVGESDSSTVLSDPNSSACNTSDRPAASEAAAKPVSKARRRRCVVSII